MSKEEKAVAAFRAALIEKLHSLSVYPENRTAFCRHMNENYLPRRAVFALLDDPEQPINEEEDNTPV